MQKLQPFLDAKPLYYDEIDYTRMPRAYASVKSQLPAPKIIHLVGTNGKGTTGRFIASALHRGGYRVGHYTSPHILRFNERIWLAGEEICDAALESAHEALLGMLEPEMAEALSYFEYTTLLAMVAFGDCEWVVLEAGLGGEHDATAVFEKTLSVFTPVDFDHQAFLGDTIEAIARTKFLSMQGRALIAVQKHAEVYEVFDEVLQTQGATGYRLEEISQNADMVCAEAIAVKEGLASYLVSNLQLAMAALRCVGVTWQCDWFANAALFGRLSRIADNIWLDVGHNAMAAEAIAEALRGRSLVLVYNSYKDKAYAQIMRILRPVVKRVEIIGVDDQRIAPLEALYEAAEAAGLSCSRFEALQEDEEYLVFGSFSVAEAFLKAHRA